LLPRALHLIGHVGVPHGYRPVCVLVVSLLCPLGRCRGIWISRVDWSHRLDLHYGLRVPRPSREQSVRPVHLLRLGPRLRCQQPLRRSPMPLAYISISLRLPIRSDHTFGVLLESIGHRDRAIAQELPVHRLDCRISRFEAIIAHKSEPPRVSIIRIPHNLRRSYDHSEGSERVVEQLPLT